MKKSLLKNWEMLFTAVYEIRERKGFIYNKFDNLTPREQKILSMRFGLENGVTCTLDEVGDEYGVTRERIRQLEARGLEQLKIII